MRFPGFIGPSYVSQSVNVDCQRCVNLFPEKNLLGTGKEQEVASLVPTPGLRLLLTLDDSPVRGLWRASNRSLFAVGGQRLYQISSDWVATQLGVLNTDSGPVSMADNGTHLVVVDGTYGYTWNMDTEAFAEISDGDFPGADQVTFLDGYFIFNEPDTENFFLSGLYDVTFDALDSASVEGQPDRLVGLIACNQNLFLFGSQSAEAFYNSGDADFPFARIQGGVTDIGCAAPFTIQKLDRSVFWIGGDATGQGIVYRTEGYRPVRISTAAVESVIRSVDTAELPNATAWTYQQGGHLFYCLNLPGIKSTWVYDASTDLWHERAYQDLWFLDRHRAECHALAHGENVVGDYQTGGIYALDQDEYTDNETPIARVRASPHFSSGLKKVRHNSFQLDMETGVGLDGGVQGEDPKVMLRWSDDGGHTWSNERMAGAGKIGKTKTRVIWRRLGSSRDRVYEVKVTDPVKTVFIGAELDVEQGVS